LENFHFFLVALRIGYRLVADVCPGITSQRPGRARPGSVFHLQERIGNFSAILPGMKTSMELENDAARQIIALMAAAARTALKTRGVDNIEGLGWFGPRVRQALGIPLSVTGKSPFFDR
jgi:hypothetical protein